MPRPHIWRLTIFSFERDRERMVLVQADFQQPVDLYERRIRTEDGRKVITDLLIETSVQGHFQWTRQARSNSEDGRSMILAVATGAGPSEQRSIVAVRELRSLQPKIGELAKTRNRGRP